MSLVEIRSQMRKFLTAESEDALVTELESAWMRNEDLTLQGILQLRGDFGGKLDTFYQCVKWLVEKQPDTCKSTLQSLAKLGLWEDLLWILRFIILGKKDPVTIDQISKGTGETDDLTVPLNLPTKMSEIYHGVMQIFCQGLHANDDGAAKWAPYIGSSYDQDTRLGKRIAWMLFRKKGQSERSQQFNKSAFESYHARLEKAAPSLPLQSVSNEAPKPTQVADNLPVKAASPNVGSLAASTSKLAIKKAVEAPKPSAPATTSPMPVLSLLPKPVVKWHFKPTRVTNKPADELPPKAASPGASTSQLEMKKPAADEPKRAVGSPKPSFSGLASKPTSNVSATKMNDRDSDQTESRTSERAKTTAPAPVPEGSLRREEAKAASPVASTSKKADSASATKMKDRGSDQTKSLSSERAKMTAPAPVPIPAGSPGREEAKVASPNGASPVASTSKKADRISPKAVPKKASAVNPAPGSPSKGPAAIPKDEPSKTAIPPKLRAVERVNGVIREIVDRLHLSQVIENRCKLLFKTIQDGNHCPSRSHKDIGSACVYISSMQEGQPHCYFEVVGNFTDTNRVALCASTIAKALDIQLTEIKAAHLTGRFATRLGLPEKIGRLATHIAQKSKELGIFKSQWQTSIAGAAIYLACEVSTIQTDTKIIGEMVGVGHTTILSSYKKLLTKKKELLPQDD